jgi:diamine N-acetyltransferase
LSGSDGGPDPQADPWKGTDVALADWARLTAREDASAAAEGSETAAPEGGGPASVELREITAENVRAVCRLAVAASQTSFVAPNAVSLAQALFEPKAWYRAIYAGDQPVGFVMLAIETEPPTYYLWRFMIAEGQQRRGYGRAAIGALVEHVRGLPGATELLVSWVPADGGPEPFYRGLGFVPTGEVHEGEVEARLELG